MSRYGLALVAAAAALFALGASSNAQASTGTMTGSFFFTQVQGNCGNATTGNKFPCSERNTARPVQNAEVWVTRASDGAALGMNYTDNSGNFSVSWTNTSTGGNATVQVVWRARVQGNRFEVGTGGVGNNYYFWIDNGAGSAQNFTATAGGTSSIGWRSWGSNPHANVYDGANKLWKSISVSNRLNAFFGTGAPKCMSGFSCTTRPVIMVDDLGLGNGRIGSCNAGSNAWADTRDNYVCLSNDAIGQSANLSRVMHELGHIAEYVSNRDQQRGDSADYRQDDPQPLCTSSPNNASCNIHTLTSQEWDSASWQEGIATHFAHVALYEQATPNPFTCVSIQACDVAAGRQNVETWTADCANNGRAEVAVQRYLWDTYDSVFDNRVVTGEPYWEDNGLSRNIWEISDTINGFDPGTGGAQRDEAPSDKDGRSSRDFNHVWWLSGTDSWQQFNMNCFPPGSDV